MWGSPIGWSVLFACAAGWGCAGELGEAPASEGTPESPVLATLQFRDAELALTSTANGVRYSVRDNVGRRRANLTLAELQAYDPELYRLAHGATARVRAPLEGRLWVGR